MPPRSLVLTAALLLSLPATAEVLDATPKAGAFHGKNLMYTTYFYTAAEAVVHGYQKNTKVRIVSLEQGRTVWKGTVGRGETKLIPTGRGVFGFLSDKKASILVGTPSSCTCVGYWLRDAEGQQRSRHFYTQLPSSVPQADAKVVVWAWEDTVVDITDLSADRSVHRGKLKAGKHYVIDSKRLGKMNSHVLQFRADKAAIAVQVYYDEGFFVPAEDGRLAGKRFRTYVGAITEGVNDLNLLSYLRPVKVKVRDLTSGKVLWSGEVAKGGIHTLTLSKKFVEVTADAEIAVTVAPYKHRSVSGYAEHHFGAGLEGMGIENDFLLTTPGEIWVFSYFDQNHVTVADASGKTVWEGTLQAGHSQGVHPGQGFYRIKGDKGMSVMGGASACGAEYSPAGGLFRVDEELLKVATVILEERRQRARDQGRELSPTEAAAPLSKTENERAQSYIRDNAGQSLSADEVQQRMDSMVTY